MALRSILSMNAFDHQSLDKLDPETRAETARRLKVFGSASVLFFQEPIEVVKGEGCYLIDRKGERFLDCYNNVACIGHGHPRVADYVAKQIKLVNTHTRYLNRLVDDYAEKLLATFPAPLSQLTFTCTGSESNDLALRESFYFTGGQGVIVTSGAYHGNSYLTTMVSPSTSKKVKQSNFVKLVPPPDSYRIPKDQLEDKFAADVEKAINEFEAEGIKFAAILFDDIFSSDGVFSDPAGFIKKAVDVVHKHGGLYIADEVQPGFGRTGMMWGFQRHGVIPDIVTMGKPMGNGFPMAATVTRPEIIDALSSSCGYFNTFGGSPAACAAGTAVLEVIKEDDLMGNAVAAGDHLRAGLRSLMSSHPCLGDVRGAGLFTGLEIVKDPKTKETDPVSCTLLVNRLRHHHVLIGCCGADGSVLKIRPPLRFCVKDADYFLEMFEASLKDLSL